VQPVISRVIAGRRVLDRREHQQPNLVCTEGAVAALNGPQDHLKIWLAEYARRRGYAHERLNSIPGISCVNAKGAFYLFPNISKLGLKSAEFCAKLLEQEKVAAVPGIAFGADDYLRISYATSMANIEKGLDRLEKFAGERLAQIGQFFLVRAALDYGR
jgi:aspartate aminotransferase